jgi:hypothetical protein
MPSPKDDLSDVNPEEIEKAIRFLETDAGKALIRAEIELKRTKSKLRSTMNEIITKLRSDKTDLSPIYQSVGEFVVRFSQIEFLIRLVFAEKVGVDRGEMIAPIMSQIDFRGLVAVTLHLCEHEHGKTQIQPSPWGSWQCSPVCRVADEDRNYQCQGRPRCFDRDRHGHPGVHAS